MRKLLIVIFSALIFLCGCSQEKQTVISETDARLSATPDELVELYFEYLEDEDYDSIKALYPEGFSEKERFPYAEDYGLEFVPLTELYDQYKGYELDRLDIFSYSFDLEMHSGGARSTHADYNEWYGYDSNGFGKINSDAYLENYKKGESAIVQFNFLFMKIAGVWYFIS